MTDPMTEAETPLAMMDQIVRLAPAELLSADGAEGLFASFEADRDLGWDRSNITFELVDHPRRALKWAMVAAAAERYVADLEIGIKNLRAQLDARTRTSFVEASAKFTEAMVAASIDSDPEWHEAQRALHEAQAKARVCGDVRELFRHRKDLLVQEALQLRLEGGGNDSVIAFDARSRQAAFERRGTTLAEAAALAANGNGARPGRTPVK